MTALSDQFEGKILRIAVATSTEQAADAFLGCLNKNLEWLAPAARCWQGAGSAAEHRRRLLMNRCAEQTLAIELNHR